MTNLLPAGIILLALPIVAVGLVFLARRLQTIPGLAGALLLSGVAGALLTAFFVFMASTVPIAPYESGRGAWNPILEQSLLSAYIGFGLGVAIAAIVVFPLFLVRVLRKKGRPQRGEAGAGGKEGYKDA